MLRINKTERSVLSATKYKKYNKTENTVEPGYSDTGYSGKPGYSGKFCLAWFAI